MIKIRMSNTEFRCRIGLSEWEELSINGKAESDFALPDGSIMRISLLTRNDTSMEFRSSVNGFSIELPSEKLSLLNAPEYGEISSECRTPNGKVRLIVEMDYSQLREKQTSSKTQNTL